MASNDSRSQKSEEFWKYLEENYREVGSWPGWMKGEVVVQNKGSLTVQRPADSKDEETRE